MTRDMSLSYLLFCVLTLCVAQAGQCAEDPQDIQPLIIITTAKTMQQALADVKSAIASNNYVFIREQHIDSRLTTTDTENRTVILIYFCNFHMLHQAMKMESRVGVFLPCRITLIQKSGYVEMVAINPKFISRRLNAKHLKVICKRLSKDYRAILEEASL